MTIIDKGCYERGCACYDDRVDKDGVAVVARQWVGLTKREVELIDEMIETQLLHAERCDHMANSTMAQKQKAWDLERVELLRKLKEKNHG